MNVFYGKSRNGTPTGELTKREVDSFQDFCESYLSECLEGEKNSYYVTIGDRYTKTLGDKSQHPNSYLFKDHYHRNNMSQKSAWLLPLDGDSSLKDKDSCIDPKIVHESLVKLGFNHAIYTTHSHVKGVKNRWRLFIPCSMDKKEQLVPTVQSLYQLLIENGCYGLSLANESKTWSVPWYLPTRDDPNDDHYEYYSLFDGKDYTAINQYKTNTLSSSPVSEDSYPTRSLKDMINIVREGKENTGLHRATRDLAHGWINDGMTPASVKVILHSLTEGYDANDPRQKENKAKINSLVDSAAGKIRENFTDEVGWGDTLPSGETRIYTLYPEQGGVMEELVNTCLNWMPYPNRQIATIACHALISTLGGRVYTMENGSGIVLTALVTGRSTIGKSFIKKFCIHALNSFSLVQYAHQFIGSHFYTSSKNLVDELKEVGSLLSVRTESGQTDKSSAGDMSRVMMYELELATNSGLSGYVSSGGQNDKIPPLFSPSVTTIRESVAEIQNEADLQNSAAVSGVTGRRSHVLIDPVKVRAKDPRVNILSKKIKKLVATLYGFSEMSERKNVTKFLEEKFWIKVKFADSEYMGFKLDEWLSIENKASMEGDHYKYTFYGRLGEKLPSWAARLAICDNPKNPIITNHHIEIAETSLIAELEAIMKQKESGLLDGDIQQCINFILSLFKGKMTDNKTLVSSHKNHHSNMLKKRAIKVSVIFNVLQMRSCWKSAFVKYPNLKQIILSNVASSGLNLILPSESKEKFNFNGPVLQIQT